jgi:oligosaccharide repeat unit polymerase
VLSCIRKEADVVSPGRVFGFVWALAVGLTDLKFSRLQSEWSLMSWTLLLVGIGSFLLGVFIVYVLHMRSSLTSVSHMRNTFRTSAGLDERRFFWFVIVVFLSYAIAYSTNVLIKGEIPWFARDPAKFRVGYGIFALGLINHAAPSIMFFAVQYAVLVYGHHKEKMLLALIFLLSGASYFLLLHRFDLAIWAVASFVFLYYVTWFIRWSTVLGTLAVFVGLLVWMQSVRLVGHIQNYLYLMSKMQIGVQYAALTEPYMYVVTNLENFARAVERLDQHTYGYFTFNALMSLTGLKHWLADYFVIDETPYLNSGFNTYSFLWTYYRDFGVLGLFLVPLILGALISWLYYRMRQAPSMVLISVYAMAVFMMVISFFHHAPSLLHFVFNTGLVSVVTLQSSRSARMESLTVHDDSGQT